MVKGIFESKVNKNSKIGLLGGTFDPVHNGHLAMAEVVLQTLGLDFMFFVPAAQPPHKVTDSITSFEKRCDMLELALATTPFELCKIESKLGGTSYTVDTIKALQQDYPDAELFFIIGQDSFNEIQTWKDFRLLPQLTCLVVVNRSTKQIISTDHVLARHFHDYIEDENGCLWRRSGQENGGICFVSMRPVLISSRQIRKRFCQGEVPVELLPNYVAEYIHKNNLYSFENFHE